MTNKDVKQVSWCIPIGDNEKQKKLLLHDEEGVMPSIKYRGSSRWKIGAKDDEETGHQKGN